MNVPILMQSSVLSDTFSRETMSDPVQSKVWSTSTLLAGFQHVGIEADLALLDAEERRLELELQDTDCCAFASQILFS